MSRLLSTMLCDVRLQFRNGFYYAATIVALFWTLVLSRLAADRLTVWMPVFILSNLLIDTFYFMAGMVLLEKGEGTLLAQGVTPLRNYEYIVSKVATLAGLAVLESFVIVYFGYGPPLAPVMLLLGVLAAAVIFALAGFLVVIRYDSINEFLFPSFLISQIFVPPFLTYFGLFESRWMYVHPLQGAVLLSKAGFGPIEAWQSWYAVVSSILWSAVGLRIARRMFTRFVISTGKV